MAVGGSPSEFRKFLYFDCSGAFAGRFRVWGLGSTPVRVCLCNRVALWCPTWLRGMCMHVLIIPQCSWLMCGPRSIALGSVRGVSGKSLGDGGIVFASQPLPLLVPLLDCFSGMGLGGVRSSRLAFFYKFKHRLYFPSRFIPFLFSEMGSSTTRPTAIPLEPHSGVEHDTWWRRVCRDPTRVPYD